MAPRRVNAAMPAPIRVRSTRLDRASVVDMDLEVPPDEDEKGSGFNFDQAFEGMQDGMLFLPESIQRVQRFKDALDSDGKMSSVEKLITYPIIAAPWEIKGVAGDKGEADFIREFFDASYENGGMMTHISEIIAQMNFGQTVSRCYFEKVPMIRERDGANIYKKIAHRPQETCELVLNARNTEVMGFRQIPVHMNLDGTEAAQGWALNGKKLDKNGYIPIMGQRAFVYIHGKWRDPIDGYGAMNVAYKCWEAKRKVWYFWSQFLETTALPKTLVKNNDEEQARADAKKVATLRNRDVIGMGTDTEVEAYESAGNGAAQFIECIRWLDSEMSNSVLGGFMDLTSSAASGKGSYALSADQSTLFLRTRRVVARDMARQITNQIIAPLIRWNFGRDAAVPQFTFGPLSEANEEKVMQLFSEITTATQATKMPTELYEQLAIRVSNIVELDPTRIQEQFDKIKEKAGDDPVQQVAGAVALATQMVEQKQAEANIKNQEEQTRIAKQASLTPTANDPNVPAPPSGGGNGNQPVRRPVAGKKSTQNGNRKGGRVTA